MIYHLLYISEVSSEFKLDVDLENILHQSRVRNKKKDITGVLIKNGNFFIQVLEGRRESVSSLYNVIQTDPRHSKIRTLFNYQDTTRIFPEWAMGHVDAQAHVVTINELIPYLHADIVKLESSKEKIISILKRFNQFKQSEAIPELEEV